MSTYKRIVSLLEDGSWHPADDLRGLTSYPQEWISELRKEGQFVAQSEDGLEVRLTNPEVVRKPRALRHLA